VKDLTEGSPLGTRSRWCRSHCDRVEGSPPTRNLTPPLALGGVNGRRSFHQRPAAVMSQGLVMISFSSTRKYWRARTSDSSSAMSPVSPLQTYE